MCISDISCSVKKQKESNFLRPVNQDSGTKRDNQLFCMKVMKTVDWITFVVPTSLPSSSFFLFLFCYCCCVVIVVFVCLFCFVSFCSMHLPLVEPAVYSWHFGLLPATNRCEICQMFSHWFVMYHHWNFWTNFLAWLTEPRTILICLKLKV